MEPLRTKTSVGYETPDETMARARTMLGQMQEPTVADTYKTVSTPAVDSAYETAASEMGNYYKQQATQPIDDRKIYRDTLSQYQAQIDATNQIYRNQLQQAQQQGLSRIGSATALSARSGTLGSDFGNAQNEKVLGYNREIESGIQAEQNAKIAEIMGMARQGAADEIARRTKAKQEGAESYLKYLSGKAERRKTGLSSLAQSFLSQGVSPDEVNPATLKQIAQQYGVSEDDIKAAYFDAKKTYDSTQAESDLKTRKTEAEIAKINADIAKGKLIEIGEGTMLYNIETGETFKNPKTYAPNSGGGSALSLNQQFTATQNLSKQVNTNTSAARELQRQSSILTDTWNRFAKGEATDLNGTSQAIITTFNKLLDPTSVVRESEYDRSAAGQALLSTISGKVAAIQQGGPGLTPASLQELVNLGNTYARNAQASIDAENKRAQEMAQYFGLNPNFVTTAGGSSNTISDDDAYQLYLNTLNASQ